MTHRIEIEELHTIRSELLRLSYELKFERLKLALKAMLPSGMAYLWQPRDWHGRWTEISDTSSDDKPQSVFSELWKYIAAGHHFVARAIFEDPRYRLSRQATQIFEKATTGPLYVPNNHKWDTAHRNYTDAVRADFEKHLNVNAIDPSKMTSDQAQSYVRRIARSRNPTIREYNRSVMKYVVMTAQRGLRGRE